MFYPEGGGQPCDLGVISTPEKMVKVTDVQRYGDVIVHSIDGNLSKGEMVHCTVDWERRMALTRHQSATHVILGSARQVLGGHVWQSGAQKGIDQSRVDISHYKKIEDDEIEKIEEVANRIILSNIPVEKIWMDRGEAERQYGFRLYQGGVPVGKKLRVVRIGDFDVEACAGTYQATENRADSGWSGADHIFSGHGLGKTCSEALFTASGIFRYASGLSRAAAKDRAKIL